MVTPETTNPAGGRGSAKQQMTGQVGRNRSGAGVQTSTPPSPDLVLSRLDRVRKAGAGWWKPRPAAPREAWLSGSANNSQQDHVKQKPEAELAQPPVF